METAAALKSGTTLENLQAAFNGESNAGAKYLAFAVKADEEGYGPVASLFRAAARAEAIHAANHAEVIRKLGGTPEAVIETAAVNTTAENLKDAIAGETYERDVMYPVFLAQARAEKSAAVKTFHYALKAEAEHARLYTEALADLENRRGAGITYYVCAVCGYTSATAEEDRCPICATPKEKYETVS
ncbi:MAG TPA: rubrerythrin family protein [Bryobacteraceae bacterium]|nr:rubrerythrin family protein [Bryobacteraceae bacterium]